MDKLWQARVLYQSGGFRSLFRAGTTKSKRVISSSIWSAPGIHKWCLGKSIDRLTQLIRQEECKEDVFKTLDTYRGVGPYRHIRPQQLGSEHEAFFNAVVDHEPASILEIGTAYGGTLYPWVRGVDSVETVTSIDLTYFGRDLEFYRAFSTGTDVDLSFFKGSSHSAKIQSQLTTHSEDLSGFEFIFIDGDHSYGGVKEDFSLAKRLATPGALLAFHDILGVDESCGVGYLWQEIKDSYDTKEIVHEPNLKRNGVGLLKLD